MSRKIKVLLADDSAVVRRVFTEQLQREPDIEVVATAPDPYVARDKIVRLQPDVLVLDIEMPRMDGITFLSKLMRYHPMPVVIVSSLTTDRGGDLAMQALSLGALEVLGKPQSSFAVGDMPRDLAEVIRAIAKVQFPRPDMKLKETSRKIAPVTTSRTTNKVIAIGASTGGTQAIEALLTRFTLHTPGALVVQHMPEQFTKSFSERLNGICEIEVKEARDNDSVVPGMALVAPGNHHMVLRRSGARYYVEIKDGPPVCRQRPSVDVLFSSVAKSAGQNAVGIILTGMGKDGAAGLLNMKNAGSYTIAQDEASSVVYGMPGEAVKLGAVCKEYALDDIPYGLNRFLDSDSARQKAGA